MKNNELIAQFMGVDTTMPHDHQGIYPYDQSFDWLMPVIEKIINTSHISMDISLWGPYSEISITEHDDDESDVIVPSHGVDTINIKLIDKLYVKVVEFIKWYNKNKK